jgi:hypothetical protein
MDCVATIAETHNRVPCVAFTLPCEDLADTGSDRSQRDAIPPPAAKKLEILGRQDVWHTPHRGKEILDFTVVGEFLF